MKKVLILVLISAIMVLGVGCTATIRASSSDRNTTLKVGDTLSKNQPTPTDIQFSLERYNLVRRSYWVNGMEEKSRSLVCEVNKPLGYIVLFSNSTTVARFIVDGKVSSLRSYLTPDSEFYEQMNGTGITYNEWLPDIDGSYGDNAEGIFFFDPSGQYYEWTGTYLYASAPIVIDDPVVRIAE